jgi:GH25 family lysozyme M1 (1,4-beta-N-acetylmuramidase)
MVGGFFVLATILCLFMSGKMDISAAETENDGVMGQSLIDETDYDTSGNNAILKAAGRSVVPSILSATSSSYTTSFLGTSFTTSGSFTDATYYHKNSYETYTMFNGIDVSWHQSTGDHKTTALDWSDVHAAGIDFAFVRVASRDSASGSLYEDTCADSHIKAALENNVNIGLYVFSQALTEAEAREEADYVLELAKKYKWSVTLPIVIDREAGSYKRLTAGALSKTKETAVCQAFADTITAAGYDATVYASYSWINSYINTTSLKNCGIWIARYNNTTTSNTKSGTAYSDLSYDYEFWQYSSMAKVSGYTGNLDADFWYKDTSIKTKNLVASANASTSVSLSWSAAGDAYGYRVYRYDDTQEKYVYLGSTKKTSYTDSGLSTGTEYKYKVRGYWTIGGTKYFGAYSTVLTTTTKPAKVKELKLTTKSSAVTLSWKKVSRATGYQIYRLNKKTGKYEKLTTVKSANTCTYKNTKLTKGSSYTYKVRAYKTYNGKNYYGSFSTAVKITVK